MREKGPASDPSAGRARLVKAAVSRMLAIDDARIHGLKARDDLGGVAGGGVVDDDDLDLLQRLREQALQTTVEIFLGAVDRHDD